MDSDNLQIDQHNSWIPPMIVSSGWLPDAGIHVRDGVLYQGISRAVWTGAAILCGCALLALIPLTGLGFRTGTLPYYVQVFIAIAFVWGALCSVLMSRFFLTWFGVQTVVDLARATVIIIHRQKETTIPLSSVLGLQILSQAEGGHELNLVYRRLSGEVTRQVLTAHVVRKYVQQLADGYQQFTNWLMLERVDGQTPVPVIVTSTTDPISSPQSSRI